jgi:hypothetical protein
VIRSSLRGLRDFLRPAKSAQSLDVENTTPTFENRLYRHSNLVPWCTAVLGWCIHPLVVSGMSPGPQTVVFICLGLPISVRRPFGLAMYPVFQCASSQKRSGRNERISISKHLLRLLSKTHKSSVAAFRPLHRTAYSGYQTVERKMTPRLLFTTASERDFVRSAVVGGCTCHSTPKLVPSILSLVGQIATTVER